MKWSFCHRDTVVRAFNQRTLRSMCTTFTNPRAYTVPSFCTACPRVRAPATHFQPCELETRSGIRGISPLRDCAKNQGSNRNSTPGWRRRANQSVSDDGVEGKPEEPAFRPLLSVIEKLRATREAISACDRPASPLEDGFASESGDSKGVLLAGIFEGNINLRFGYMHLRACALRRHARDYNSAIQGCCLGCLIEGHHYEAPV